MEGPKKGLSNCCTLGPPLNTLQKRLSVLPRQAPDRLSMRPSLSSRISGSGGRTSWGGRAKLSGLHPEELCAFG